MTSGGPTSAGKVKRGLLMDKRLGLLSPEEQRIVRLVCAGLSNAEIAARLDKRVGTVKNQLSSAYRKLGVKSRTMLVIRLGR